VRRPICEMHVHMIHAVAGKEIGQIQGIACALFCLGTGPVFALVLIDQVAWLFAASFRVSFEDF
jgi:hypothetical protein